MRRSAQDSAPGLWEFPGGKAEKGESYRETGIREAREETGLMSKSLKYVGRYNRPRRSGHGLITMVLTHCESFSGKVKLSKEHSGYKWLPKKKILSSKNYANDVYKFFELRER